MPGSTAAAQPFAQLALNAWPRPALEEHGGALIEQGQALNALQGA